MNISQAGVQFIASNEGYAAHVYNDAGKQAIGYGHDLLPGESFPNGVTQQEALDILGRDCAKVDEAMQVMVEHGLIPADVTQGQWDALADFGYNEGIAALRMLLSHGWSQIPVQIVRWFYMRDKDGNLVASDGPSGLLARRQKELAMWLGHQTP